MSNLFSEVNIGGLVLKNRTALAPIENGYAKAGGRITERLIRFYEKCAENECGMIFTGSVAVDFDGKGVPSQLEIFDEECWPGFEELTKRVHGKNCRAAIQLYHAGRQLGEHGTAVPIAPSAENCGIFKELPPPKAMDRADMDRIRERFYAAAKKAVELGFDFIEVHFAHGYLLHSFLSPHSNRREDEYGGSLENRMRYPMEILRTVIEAADKKVPVGVRLSVEEYLTDGLRFDEAVRICEAAEDAGAAALSVSAGSYDSMEYMIQPMHIPAGFLREYSRRLKEILSVPVIVAGRQNTAELIRGAVEDGDADIVAVGRGFYADPEIIRKIKEGREEEIRCCTGCNQGCLSRIFVCRDVRCIFNAQTGFEGVREVKKAEKPLNIGVVGAGITGLTLARYMAGAGHRVTVFDEEAGGKLRAMAKPKDRENFELPLTEAKQMMKRLKVKWVRKKITSEEELKSYEFDRVFLATGSVQQKIKTDKLTLMEASEAMLDVPEETNIAVVGGGLFGLEAARYLAMEKKNVAVFEQGEALGKGVGDTFIGRITDELDSLGVKIYLKRRVASEEDVLSVCPGTKVIVQSCGYGSGRENLSILKNALPVGSVKGDMSILECGDDAWNAYEELAGQEEI